MKELLRALGAVIAALCVAFLLVIAVELFSSVVYPLPEDFGGTMEEMCRHVERYPTWVLAACGAFWVATAFISAWVARAIGNVSSAIAVGLLLTAALVFNVVNLPYALWFKIAILLLVPAALYAGGRRSHREGPPAGRAAG